MCRRSNLPRLTKIVQQFRVQMAAIRCMPSLLMSQSNIHINGIGGSGRTSMSSTDYTSERGKSRSLSGPHRSSRNMCRKSDVTCKICRMPSTDIPCLGSLDGAGMPEQDCLPSGPQRIEKPSWSNESAFGSYSSYQSCYPLVPQPLTVSRKAISGSISSESGSVPASPMMAESGAFSIGSVLAGDIDEKDKKRMTFVGKLIGRGRRESSIVSNPSNAVYPGT